MEKRGPGRSGPLTPAERRQRQEAAEASGRARQGRHQAETTPSIRQGSTGDPSARAVGLFRAGQTRTRQGRSLWDPRTTEPTVGRIQAEVRFHFPKAYRSTTPEPPQKGRPLLARALGRIKPRRPGQVVPHQAVVIQNPRDLIEAQRHPEMRAIVQHTVNVVRDHQRATIERGRERGLIPEGVWPSTVVQAYRHAALKAMHKAGLIDYRTAPMDQTTKRELRPLNRFMFYAHRRVFDHLNQGPLQGKWDAFRQEFGELYRQRKYGKYTGHERMRMRPDNEFIKLDVVNGDLEKAFGQMVSGFERVIDRPLVRTGMGATGLGVGAAGYAHARKKKDGPTKIVYVPEPPGGIPRIAGAHLHVRDAAKHVEGHFQIPKIGGSTRKTSTGLYRILPADELAKFAVPGGESPPCLEDLNKQSLSFMLGDPLPDAQYTTDPNRQLNRAMRPRIKRRAFRLRLNTQRHMRRLLSGGITHQERWMLGASSRPSKSMFKQDLKAEARELDRQERLEHRLMGRLPATRSAAGDAVRRLGRGQKPKAVVRRLLHEHATELLGRRSVKKGIIGDAQHFGRVHLPRIRGSFARASHTGGAMMGGLGRIPLKLPTRPLRKAIAGSVLRAMNRTGHLAAQFGGQTARRHKLATGIAAGMAIPAAYHSMKDHPTVRAIAGAAAAGGAAALLSRGRALRAARTTSHAIYRTGLKNAVRQHAQVLAGGTPSPHLKAQARQAYNTIKGQALMRAKAHRRTAMAGWRVPKGKVGAAAALGAGVGASMHERRKMPPLYQLAEQQGP